ncbi:helix-turn-helix transcriptional regulator [Pseudoalteromonas phenolica]|uniref:helix-turn-helix transcriptional regulator n=1 Tax=Pseudoalteromonas phenolica TaxID=161398 RepID=UPI00384BB301
MTRKDRLILLSTLLIITVLIAVDLSTDLKEGVALWHLVIEGAAGVMALIGIAYIFKDIVQLKQDLQSERALAKGYRAEAELWREKSKTYLDGLSILIDEQLTLWQLTPAEREVAFLLLKGMSLKELAELRGTSEKTARAQSMSIYAKAGLSGRSELSAFFLEDLLPARDLD